MKAGSFTLVAAALVGMTSAMTPSGLIPSNKENMTVFFNTSALATNGAAVSIAGAKTAPMLALDKNLAGKTFAVVMIDPDPKGVGNGSNAILHWMQDGFSSSATSITIAGKTVFPLVNTKNTTAVETYLSPGPPVGSTHRYTQYLLDTTGKTTFPQAGANFSRGSFTIETFLQQINMTAFSANFFNATGGT
ncbi:hypothetical protein BP5796_07580 [Coleophoma crateriformis]|uniref:PEBP-like protein n=1 Tax=Coleophoma crateriformis TaxID=565419 RepID=A0A3D8RJM5_9HELO|nr:hypothetical protein BP5796_07580 [Coleophoma crateriformis]